MPPKAALTGSFNVADAANEVVCPLQNNDGSTCRKRCFGEKRYRSMQEHIRRAHPDHYISKLPATEESFILMINTPPSQRPQPPLQPNQQHPGFMADPGGFYDQDQSSQVFSHHDARRPSFVPTANAAAALAQLHNSRPESDWDVDREPFQDPTADQPFPNYFSHSDSNIFSDTPNAGMNDTKEGSLLPSTFQPASRSASQQPFQRQKPNRPRKSSVTENARRGKHERQRSKDHKRSSGERKGLSAEPGSLIPGKRWEDLLDAAASATEEDSRDLTPIPQSPRGSVPPYQGQNHNNQFQSYNASPLQNTILPHPSTQAQTFEAPSLEAFPSVESAVDNQGTYQGTYQHGHNSSADSGMSNPFNYTRPSHQQQSSSGSNFHMAPSGLSSSPNDMPSSATSAYSRNHTHSHSWTAPGAQYDAAARSVAQQAPPALVQHYCAACHRVTPLSSSYACTECICGICRDCVDVLVSMGPDRGARCPHCHTSAGRFKPFMLDLR